MTSGYGETWKLEDFLGAWKADVDGSHVVVARQQNQHGQNQHGQNGVYGYNGKGHCYGKNGKGNDNSVFEYLTLFVIDIFDIS